MTLAQAVARAETLLAAAVHSQLESDVPLGTLPSGGIDSSSVSFTAQQALGGELHTFNVCCSEQQYDET
jgi:asparagine synthetase B (glutamine-hydrolysing)